jgi:hypothetical protein
MLHAAAHQVALCGLGPPAGSDLRGFRLAGCAEAQATVATRPSTTVMLDLQPCYQARPLTGKRHGRSDHGRFVAGI